MVIQCSASTQTLNHNALENQCVISPCSSILCKPPRIVYPTYMLHFYLGSCRPFAKPVHIRKSGPLA